MKKRISRITALLISTLALLIAPATTRAQEAIRDGSFESTAQPVHYLQIHGHFNQQTFSSYWTTPTAASPDMFSNVGTYACGNINSSSDNPGIAPNFIPYACYPQACPTENSFGTQNPKTGSNYAGFSPSTYEYIQTYPFDPSAYPNGLTAGQCYKLVFWASRADESTQAIRLQAVVSKTNMQDLNSTGLLAYTSDAIVLTTPHFIENKQQWTQVVFEFKATGGEKYLTIGLFDIYGTPDPVNPIYNIPTIKNESSMAADCGGANNPCALCAASIPSYYYIDDVSLTPTVGASFGADYIFTNANPNISGTFSSGTKILLSGQVSITSNTTFDGCDVRCNMGTSITVNQGNTFELKNGTTITAGCNMMWDGIDVRPGGIIHVYSSAAIQDAIQAVNIDGGIWQFQNCTFAKNVADINFRNSNIGWGYLITGVTFDHTADLNDPTLGYQNKGKFSITADGMDLYSNPIEVGGPNATDVCYFYGGKSGIQSNDADMNVQRCLFSGGKDFGIDFSGNNPSNNIRKLTVTSCAFSNNEQHIRSQHRTDLTVQKSSFANSLHHAVDWEDNHDCHLLIGDPTNATLGNTFQNNAWCDIVAWDNATAQTDAHTNAINVTNLYTSIVIANNEIYTPLYGGGILVGEWALSQNPTYHSLNISKNTIHNSIKGIQVYNVKGWGGIQAVASLSTLPPQAVFGNMCYTTTAQTPSPYAIRVKNTAGLSISENGVVSDNCGDYQNVGIIAEDSPYSKLYGNIENAGTCMQLGLDMTGSEVHCNLFGYYSTGFALNYTWLRSGMTDLHGSNVEEYNNVVPYTSYPWNADIVVDNSDKGLNQWVWNGAGTNLTILYVGNTGSASSLISTTTGTDQCSGPLGHPLYSVGGSNTHAVFSNDVYSQWRADYTYESIRLATGDGDSTIVSDTIKNIIAIEDKIARGAYGEAKTLLSSLSVASGIETNYKEVLTILADINDTIKRDPDSTELAVLTSIAEQNSRTGGNAVTLARAFLAVRYNLYYEDEQDHSGEVNGTATIAAPCALGSESHILLGLMDADGNTLDMDTTYVYEDGSFAFDRNKIAYYQSINSSTEYRIYSKQGSQYTVVDHSFKKLGDWLTATPYSLALSGVAVALDTITEDPYEEISTVTKVPDGAENSYEVTVYDGAHADFRLQKTDGHSAVVWTRVYDGPVSGNDTVTCVALDATGNIYVAGEVYNGMSYDVQVIKYDPDGYILWESTVADSSKNNNHPTGIYVDSEDQSVHLVATVSDTTGITGYRFIQFWQCLPGESRLAHTTPNENSVEASSSLVSFYPNPTDGSITIVADDLNGIVELYNLEGQLVFTGNPDKRGSIRLPQSIVADGIYLLKFTINEKSSFNKVVIHHN